MNDKIDEIISKFLFPLSDHENSNEELAAVSILLRGFVTCNNDSKNIEDNPLLLMGVNPSFNGEYAPGGFMKPFTFQAAINEAKSKNNHRDFWYKKWKQFGDLSSKMAYLDLFPIRESDQILFEQVFRNPNVKPEDDKLTKLRADLLGVTQEAIEKMLPRLIVHANRQSMYYWGIKPKQQPEVDANDYENPWMGYKVKRVVRDLSKFGDKAHLIEFRTLPPCMTDERLERFPLYQIVGFLDNTKRIKHETAKSSLEGCFLMEYIMDDRKKEGESKMYRAEEWSDIWDWVKKYAESHK